MIDCEYIKQQAEEALRRMADGADKFIVSCTCSPGNDVELLIDGDTSVGIGACIELSRAIEAGLDRDKEDFQLTVASAGIGSELRVLRQYKKLVGKPVEVLLKNGTKIIATLDAVDEKGLQLSYEERQTMEGAKRKQTVRVERSYTFDEIKWTKEYLDFK